MPIYFGQCNKFIKFYIQGPGWFKFTRQIAAFNLQNDIKSSKLEEAPAYAYVSSFFDAVIDTLN